MKLVLALWKYSLLSIVAYRTSFLMQAGFMFINDIFLVTIFVLFFQKFGTMGGMTFDTYIILFSFQMMMFGVVHTFFAGYEEISVGIREGRIDNHLLTPKSVLLKILTSKMDFSAIGDFFAGLVFLIYFVPHIFQDAGLLVRMALAFAIGTMTWVGIMVFYHSLSFYIGSSEKIAEGGLNSMMTASFFPPDVYQGVLTKILLLTAFPTFFVFFYPYLFTVSNWDVKLLGYSLFGSLIFLSLGIFTFNHGIKRYESGNLMVTNV